MMLAVAFCCLAPVCSSWAQEDYEGSPNVARMAGKAWPEPVDRTVEFDRASRAVILGYMVELQMANRMLMLLKRHGVMLFHDIHPKAFRALPVIFRATAGAVVWGECRDLPGAVTARQLSRSVGS